MTPTTSTPIKWGETYYHPHSADWQQCSSDTILIQTSEPGKLIGFGKENLIKYYSLRKTGVNSLYQENMANRSNRLEKEVIAIYLVFFALITAETTLLLHYSAARLPLELAIAVSINAGLLFSLPWPWLYSSGKLRAHEDALLLAMHALGVDYLNGASLSSQTQETLGEAKARFVEGATLCEFANEQAALRP